MNEEDTKVADIFEKDIENFGNNLDKMIEHLNIVIATHNKQVEEIERLHSIIKEVREYIKNNKQYAELEDYGKNGEYYIDEIGLLGILDKENSNGSI